MTEDGPMTIDEAVNNIVGLSSHTDSSFDPDKVRSYVKHMVELIRSSPETLAQINDPIHLVAYHVFRYEHCYAHLEDFCCGRIQEPITIESCNEYLATWDQAHPVPGR